MINTNVVTKKSLREVQKKTLHELSEILRSSFGPNGSFSGITKDNMETKYTKDGHTILSNVYYTNQLERSIKRDIEDITRYIVKEVGDGTTSAVLLSAYIFSQLCLAEAKDQIRPSKLISLFKQAVKNISDKIESQRRECTVEDIYNIALISTNNNEDIANSLKEIYEKYGLDVFIDVTASVTGETEIKVYDGMTLETGYADTCYINDKKTGTATIKNPKVYVFDDPVDTPQMAGFFDKIIYTNILEPVNTDKPENIVPTVILAPKISSDIGTYMRDLAKWLYQIPELDKPPILIITNIYNAEQLSDIARLCDAKPIKKYLNPENEKVDIKKGLAPDMKTITKFCGEATEVVSDAFKTKFVEPKLMFRRDSDGLICINEKGGKIHSEVFDSIITFLEAELARAKAEGADNNVTGNLKRRLNSLKANLVEFRIGGIASSDRDSLRDAVEDAVLNCRSAARNGVGYGANFEGLKASKELYNNTEKDETFGFSEIYFIIYNAYYNLAKTLYFEEDSVLLTIDKSLELDKPYNITTGEYDGKVLSSIKTDPIILDGITKIVTLMFTANQFILETPLHNVYPHDEEEAEE